MQTCSLLFRLLFHPYTKNCYVYAFSRKKPLYRHPADPSGFRLPTMSHGLKHASPHTNPLYSLSLMHKRKTFLCRVRNSATLYHSHCYVSKNCQTIVAQYGVLPVLSD